MGRDGDDWMSDGNEFQRSDAATGNVHRWPPWSRLVVVDAANAELQGRPRHDYNDLGKTADEPQCWEQTEGAAVSTLEARPGQSCRSRVLST